MLELINLILVASVLGTLGKMKFIEVVMVIKIYLIAFVYLYSSKKQRQYS